MPEPRVCGLKNRHRAFRAFSFVAGSDLPRMDAFSSFQVVHFLGKQPAKAVSRMLVLEDIRAQTSPAHFYMHRQIRKRQIQY